MTLDQNTITDKQTDGQMDNAISRVAFATENFSEGGSGRVSNNLFNAFFL